MSKRLQAVVLLLLCSCIFPMYFMMKDYKLTDLSQQTISLITQAQNFNIGNAVTFIYLGERATDTVFEALIVIITALSMEYLRRRR